MPLDGHSYLVAQGWSGKGSGLRHGAIARPLAIPQKKTLSGLGKDRDEAFPFWDHIYTVAAKTIQVKLHKDEDDESDSDSSTTPCPPMLARTGTGILSNRRPVTGTPVSTSGSMTPSLEASYSTSPPVNSYRISLVAEAKRDAARKGLYSRFFRGPVLGPYDDFECLKSVSASATTVETIPDKTNASVANQSNNNDVSDLENSRNGKDERKKRKSDRSGDNDDDEIKKAKKLEKKRRKDKGKEKESCGTVELDQSFDERKRKRKKKRIHEDECDSEQTVSKKKRKRGPPPEGALFEVAAQRYGVSNKKREKDQAIPGDVATGAEHASQKEDKQKKEEKRRRKKERAEKRKRKERKMEKLTRKAE